MKRWIGLALLVFIGTAGWRIGSALSPDALSMAVGVLFGVMAGVPTALLVMAGNRRPQREAERNTDGRARQQATQPMYLNGPGQNWGMPYAQQPPIIVVAGPQGMQGGMHSGMQNGMQGFGGNQPPAHAGWFPQDAPDRTFNVVGEREALIEDW